MLYVLDRQTFVELARSAVSRFQHAAYRGIVFVGLGDCLLEDGGIRCDTAQAVLFDQLLQFSLRDEAAREKIEPRRLAVFLQFLNWIHRVLPRAICSLAASMILSVVNPNFFKRSVSGADEPNVCIPTIVPLLPVYRSHPITEPCSTATRAVMCGGRTLFR